MAIQQSDKKLFCSVIYKYIEQAIITMESHRTISFQTTYENANKNKTISQKHVQVIRLETVLG